MEHAIWTEKYRPSTFSEVKGQDAIVKRAKAFVEQENMPHLLFAGPAGIGKTTLALVIAKTLYQDKWHENVLELNASDERGIDIIRVKVKEFARTRALGNVPFKIIYLDECDALTKEAQQALRRTMENYTQTCRFILSCNYSSKIIDPIQSRCTLFRFKPLAKEDIFTIIDRIAKEEGLSIDVKAKEALYMISQGDVRRLENVLQSSTAVDKTITEELLFSVVSMAKPKEVAAMLEATTKKDFKGAKKLLLDTMLNHGLSGLDMIKQIQQGIWSLPVPDEKKLAMVNACGETEFRMVEGSDEFIQLEALLALFCAK